MEQNINTENEIINLASNYFFTKLAETEDLESFIRHIDSNIDRWKQSILVNCIERFDSEIRQEVPSSWKAIKRLPRTIVCVFGKITFYRTLFQDNYGRNRYLCDELLGIVYRKKYSDDAVAWLMKRVVKVSYGQAAKDFKSLTGVYIPKMTIWNMVQQQAALIQDHYQKQYGEQISVESICVESDGIFVAMQSPTRRKEAISRKIKGQDYKKTSFEIKVAATYAGKTEDKGYQKRRANLNLLATVGSGNDIMDAINNQIKNEYDAKYLKKIYYGTDGGRWCKNHKLDEINNKAKIEQSLDKFHIMKAIWAVFPKGNVQDWFVYLIIKRRPEKFADNLNRILQKLHGQRRKKARKLLSYVNNNIKLLKADFNLGTMEGTNAHVWAKRMKNIGCSWSKRGANAMAILLAHLYSNKKVIAQTKNIFFSEADNNKKEKALQSVVAEIFKKSHDVYEPETAHINNQTVKDLILPSTVKYPN